VMPPPSSGHEFATTADIKALIQALP
jgi:hypothetical protein